MDWTIAGYLTYLAITVPVTLWVARTLSRNGAVFLRDVYADQPDLADAINQLLVVGFYLLNLGFVLIVLRAGGDPGDAAAMIAGVSLQVGAVLVVVAFVHLVNISVFTSMRRNHVRASARAAAHQQAYGVR